jgi:hypothetical protein
VRNGLAAQNVTQAAEETEDVDRALHFALAFHERLAFLPREQLGEIGLAGFQDLRSLAEDAPARNGRQGRPCGKSLLRGVDGCLRIFFAGERIFRDGLPGIGWVLSLVNLSRTRADRFAADQVCILTSRCVHPSKVSLLRERGQ